MTRLLLSFPRFNRVIIAVKKCAGSARPGTDEAVARESKSEPIKYQRLLQ